jgi:NADPH:quinone reductase-like Zn-dependent oxidoreductase
MRAVQLTSFGDPVDVLQYVDIPEPDAPGPNQVLIGVEFSPINPNDLMVAQGIYAFRPPLPAVIGNEGVGRVLAVGPGVESVKVGDRILAPPASFTWRERIVVSAGGLPKFANLITFGLSRCRIGRSFCHVAIRCACTRLSYPVE